MKAQRVNRLKNVEDSNNAFNFWMKQLKLQVVLSSKRDHSRRQKTFMECSKDDYNQSTVERVTQPVSVRFLPFGFGTYFFKSANILFGFQNHVKFRFGSVNQLTGKNPVNQTEKT